MKCILFVVFLFLTTGIAQGYQLSQVRPEFSIRTVYTLSELNNLSCRLSEEPYQYISGCPVMVTRNHLLFYLISGSSSGLDYADVDTYLMVSDDGGYSWSVPRAFLDGVTGFQDDVYIECKFAVCDLPGHVERLWCVFTVDSLFYSYSYATFSDDCGLSWYNIDEDCWYSQEDTLLNISRLTNMQGDFHHRRCGLYAGPGTVTSNGRLIFYGYGNTIMHDYFIFACYTDNQIDGVYSVWCHTPAYYNDQIHSTYSSSWNSVELSNGSGYATMRGYVGEIIGGPHQYYYVRFQSFCHNYSSGGLWVEEPFVEAFPDDNHVGYVYRLKDSIILLWSQYGNLTVGLSDDDCRSWSYDRVIGVAAGGNAVVSGDTVFCSFDTSSCFVNMSVFNLWWITGGRRSVMYETI